MFDPLVDDDSPWGATPAPSAAAPPPAPAENGFGNAHSHIPPPISPGAANGGYHGGPTSPLGGFSHDTISPGLYGKEPQIYGQVEPGLVSPSVTTASNGARMDRTEPYLRVRITALDRNRRDILVRFDAQVRTI
jgi:hypothetical protein